MGSTSGIGLISKQSCCTYVVAVIDQSKCRKRMLDQNYEVLGMIPIGTAYMIMNTQQIRKVSAIKRIRPLVFWKIIRLNWHWFQSVSAKPVYVDFATVVDSFKQKKIDILLRLRYGVLPYN